jgi:pyruvate,water dikinase
MRRCERNASRTLDARPWRARAARWWSEDRPREYAANRVLTAVDPNTLDDPALARHLERCEQLAMDGYKLHFELHGTDMFPVGLLLDACRRWGIDVSSALDLVMDQVADRRRVHLEPEDLAHCIVAGYDIDRLRLSEMPDHIVDAVTAEAAPPSLGARLDRVDEAVPLVHREQFDILFGDARAVFPVRDDNGVIVGAWRMGLLRRAYLVAGERLVASGTIERAEHALEATVPELARLFDGDAAGDHAAVASRLDRRAAERAFWAESDPPLRLGRAADPPMGALPDAMRAIVGAQLMLRDLIERAVAPDLEGFGVGTTASEGTARVVSGVDDAMTRLEPGDVLVVRATSPAFNAVLPLAAALVTEHGGAISHAAIAARELGIPAVVGVHDATRQIRDGERVRVDPVSGRVTLLDPRPSVRAG